MTLVELEAPAPARRTRLSLDRVVRGALLALLLFGWVTVLPAKAAIGVPIDRFVADARAHRIESVRYVHATRQLRWSSDWLHWYKTSLGNPLPDPGPSPDGLSLGVPSGESTDGDNGGDLDWVHRVLDAAGLPMRYQDIDVDEHQAWTAAIPWHGLSLAASLGSILTFCLMLGREQRRITNRWGWFWLFAIGGGAAAWLYLLLEPMPLWRRRPPATEPRPASGGTGFLWAIGVRVVTAVAAGLLVYVLG